MNENDYNWKVTLEEPIESPWGPGEFDELEVIAIHKKGDVLELELERETLHINRDNVESHEQI